MSFINDDLAFPEEASKTLLKMNYRAGFQAGKTHLLTILIAKLLNWANSYFHKYPEKKSDIFFLGASMNSLKRNVINRLCSLFTNIEAPASNSNFWKLSKNLTVFFATTQLIGYHPSKGGSCSIIYADELDSVHESVLDLLSTRTTGKIEAKNGTPKTVFMSSSNPKPPCHYFTKFIQKEAPMNKLFQSSTYDNAFLSKDAIRSIELQCGNNSNKKKAFLYGESVYLQEESSCFPTLNEQLHFINENIDSFSSPSTTNNSKEKVCFSCNLSLGSNIDKCDACFQSTTMINNKKILKSSIGLDAGTSASSVLVANGYFLNEKHKMCCLALDEVVYEDNHDAKFTQEKGDYTSLMQLKKNNFIALVRSLEAICPSIITFTIPHDAPSQVLFYQDIINSENLPVNIIRSHPKKWSQKHRIEKIKYLLNNGRLSLSKCCKALKTKFFS